MATYKARSTAFRTFLRTRPPKRRFAERIRIKDIEDFFENGAIGLHIVSGEGIILRANQAELALLGYKTEEYIGRHIAEFHVDAPVIGEILQKLSCGEQLDRHPARLRAKDGSIKDVLITSNSRFDDSKFVNTRCFTLDVTHLREAERARRESEERLAATYEAATIGIAEADETGRLVRVNDAICKMLGRSREELLSMTFPDYTHLDDRVEDVANYARQVRGELDGYAVRKRAWKPDGTIVYLDVYASGCAMRRDGSFTASGSFRMSPTPSGWKIAKRAMRQAGHFDGLPDGRFVAVGRSGVDQTITGLNGRADRLWRFLVRDLPHTKAELRNAVAVVEEDWGDLRRDALHLVRWFLTCIRRGF